MKTQIPIGSPGNFIIALALLGAELSLASAQPHQWSWQEPQATVLPAGGYRNWEHVMTPKTEARFGHAFYLDGAFKNYHFNNVAWGKSKGPTGKLANTSAFQEIISYQNPFFNNTIYNFVRGSRRQAPQAGRVKFLGNIWQGMGRRVFRDADPARTAKASNEADAGVRRGRYAIDTDACARNVFYDVGKGFGVFEPSGRWHTTLQSFRDALEGYKPLAATVGIMAEQPPLRDAAAHDFRPSANSAARGLGVKVFVPWSLYETVAEWNFYPIPGDPARILDEHWCMSPYYTTRDNYYRFPTCPLHGAHVRLKDYEHRPLKNWTTGALHFDGAGYVLGVNQSGGITLATTSEGKTAWLESRLRVNDGRWHHVIAEADRKAKTFTVYIDGKQVGTGPGIGTDVSLAPEADLYVAGTPSGHDLNGAIDFLRIARGTLADSTAILILALAQARGLEAGDGPAGRRGVVCRGRSCVRGDSPWS